MGPGPGSEGAILLASGNFRVPRLSPGSAMGPGLISVRLCVRTDAWERPSHTATLRAARKLAAA